jgi:hypothetical protein
MGYNSDKNHVIVIGFGTLITDDLGNICEVTSKYFSGS